MKHPSADTCEIYVPPNTLSPEVAINATKPAKKASQLFTCFSAVKRFVASWVLPPSSAVDAAMQTVPKNLPLHTAIGLPIDASRPAGTVKSVWEMA